MYTGILSSTSTLRRCAASPPDAHWCRRDVRTAGDDDTLRDTGRCGEATAGGVADVLLLLMITTQVNHLHWNPLSKKKKKKPSPINGFHHHIPETL